MLNADVWVDWLHIMAAAVWAGSMLFTSLVVQPVLREQLKPAARLSVYREIGRRFVPLQWGCWAALAATGALKVWSVRSAPIILFGPWGRILAAKLLLVSAMVVLSILHSHRWGPRLLDLAPESPEYGPLVSKMAFWGKVNLALLLAIVFCASLLRFNPW